MQNFTLGKKGYSLLLFLLVLLIGSSPSFGQTNCPTPGGTPSNQTFCYLQTVGDINTDGNAIYSTADSTNDTQAIPDSELLANDVYYAGNSSSTCTTRVAINVTVNSAPYPNNTIFPGENSFTLSNCSGTFTAEQLATYFEPIENSDYEIRVYSEEFGNTLATGPLVNNESYFVGQISPSQNNTTATNCPSLRVAVGYEQRATPPPTATSPQTFCNGATVGDLEAQGTSPNTQTIRWYRTATSPQPLPNSTLLINGQTYYATQIINNRNDPFPPCESDTRRAVEVIIQDRTNVESTQEFCESIGEGNDFRMPQVRDLSPEGGTFFAEENSTTPLDPNTVLVEGEDYFNRDNATDCSQDRITVNFRDTPNAGSTTQTSTCENETPFNLVDRISDSQLGAPDRDGTFSPALSTGTQIFNPADYAPGTYTFNYNVGSTSSCPDDTAVISVEVLAAPNAGPGGSFDVCSNDVPAILADPAQFAGLLPAGITPGGTLSPTLSQLAAQFSSDPSTPLTTEYTVTSGNGCSDSATYTVNVIPSPNAGDDSSVTLSTQQDPVNLFSYINGNPDSGGTFSPGNANGDLDPANYTAGDYVFTYTVTSSNGCSDSSELTVTITDQIICPDVTDDTQEFCESISDADGNNPRRPQVRDLMPLNTVWYATATSTDPLSPNQVLEDEEDYFAGNANGDCPNRERVFVQIGIAPNAGATTNITACRNEDPFDIVNRLNPSILGPAMSGGNVTPAFTSGTTVFNPAVDAAGSYTYTVRSEFGKCDDDFTFVNITITEPTNANAGDDVEESFCSNDGIIDLYSLIPDGVNTNGVFEGFENGQFDTSENIGENEITYTVDDEEGCVIAGSATYTITVFEAPNAGPGADLEFCITEIQEMSDEEALAIFENLIPDDVTDGGDFSTSINELIIQFSANPTGEFTTTYTVSNENCTDTATYTVTISDTEAADAGSNVDDLVFCSTDADVNLNDFLSDDALQNGNFEELENGIFSPSTAGVGTFTFTFTVDDSSDCVTGSDSAIYTVEVIQGPNAGDDSSVSLSTEQDPVNLFDYINGNPDSGGIFSPGNANGDLDPADYTNGDYVFTYTVSSANECSDSSELTVTITDQIICPDVTDETQEFCESISDADGNNPRRPQVRDLMPMNIVWYDTATSTEALSPTETLRDNEDYFAGNANGDCPNRERVNVQIGIAPNAGATTNITACRNEAPFDIVSRLNPSILGAASAGGTVTPAFASGTTVFNPAVDPARGYTYTVQSEFGKCDDDFTIVNITITEPVPANAGEIASQTACSSDDSIMLSAFLTGSGATLGGTFSGPGVTNGMFSPSTTGEGDFTITYTVTDEANCVIEGTSDTAEFEITVLEPTDANAGGNQTPPAYCVTEDGDVELVTLLGDEANPFGSFELNGEEITSFNPAELGIGEFVITYSLDENDCAIGTDNATITITVTETPDAPVADANQSFCLIDNPTVGDIVATGDNVVIYEDEALEEVADGTTPLANDAVYYAVSTTGDNGCNSEAVMITITLTDGTAPTLQTEGNEFCRSDNPTIQDLINNLSGSGIQIYQASTGGTALAASTALEDGVTYFASGTDASGCESSERLGIRVEVAFCGIPEAFSPNGDNINDQFVIPDIATDFPNYTIEIFNRWGNVVFKGNASTGDWDGVSNQSATLGDNILPAGVYFYILNYNDGQTAPVQGKVYLSR